MKKKKRQNLLEPPTDVGIVEDVTCPVAVQQPPGNVVKVKRCPCPICWNRDQGTGLVYASRDRKQYLKCTSCGHTWVGHVNPVTGYIDHVTYKIVTYQTRNTP